MHQNADYDRDLDEGDDVEDGDAQDSVAHLVPPLAGAGDDRPGGLSDV